MKKLSDKPLCFPTNPKEAIKYGLSLLSQLKENPEITKFGGFP